jgi:hypothetical protein
MNKSLRLCDLAGGHIEPPYGFEEFRCRRAAAASRRRATSWGIAASLCVLGLVAALALVTQPPGSTELVRVTPQPAPAAPATDAPYQPALVDVGRFEITSELEDHIALLDAQISVARVYRAPPERAERRGQVDDHEDDHRVRATRCRHGDGVRLRYRH